MRENLQQTVRFILANAFVVSDPALTKLFHDIFAAAPTLFDTIIPRSEQQVFSEGLELIDKYDEIDVAEPVYESL